MNGPSEKNYADLLEWAQAIIDTDDEVDIELAGRKLYRTRKIYVDDQDQIAYRVNLEQIVRHPDGTEKERKDLNKVPGNVNQKIPLIWTGKMFPKADIVRRFVFSRKYQLRHINGVTFDFLYRMAEILDRSGQMVLVGAGTHGTDPILLSRGGQPYRGFLEGRIDGDRYLLILHLSDIELRGLGE